MELVLRHDLGELGPKTIDEWATPNGDECLLIWMLREVERMDGSVELVTVIPSELSDMYEERRP